MELLVENIPKKLKKNETKAFGRKHSEEAKKRMSETQN